jgi:hypothetical protein
VNVAIVYTAVTGGNLTTDLSARFVATWEAFPPGAPCDLWVVCNGGPLLTEQVLMFAPMNARMFPRVNDGGKDLTGYQDAARGPCADYDAVLFLGESIYFHRAGWLKRLVEAWQRYGPGFYGPFGSNNTRAHLQTSAFFCSPATLLSYPIRPLNRASRFDFEHGEHALWRRVAAQGNPVRCVTWDGEWLPQIWRLPRNTLWRGDQSNLLMMNNHAEAWANATPFTKHQWSMKADAQFK